ncbi:MAG: NapC/NirT family cytochrome c [bacterium]
MKDFVDKFTLAGIILGISLGLAAGLGAYTFIYAKGGSYLTNDPAACANCHVMSEHYSGWIKSSHRAVAVCNDCHTPPGFVAKYATKASNGFWHSFLLPPANFRTRCASSRTIARLPSKRAGNAIKPSSKPWTERRPRKKRCRVFAAMLKLGILNEVCSFAFRRETLALAHNPAA